MGFISNITGVISDSINSEIQDQYLEAFRTDSLGQDMLVKRAAVTSSAYASCCQAAGAAAIEAYCDLINDEIKAEYEAKGLYARPRFSPGYGDLALSHQKDWFRLLDITKNTGIELTDSLLMVPTKSVTAIIGLSPNKLPCIKQGCEACTMSQTCAFSRKE